MTLLVVMILDELNSSHKTGLVLCVGIRSVDWAKLASLFVRLSNGCPVFAPPMLVFPKLALRIFSILINP
jgi:hypothetical protein